MAINNLDGIIAGLRQTIAFNKTASRTAVASVPFSIFDLAGGVGAGKNSSATGTSAKVGADAASTSCCVTESGFAVAVHALWRAVGWAYACLCLWQSVSGGIDHGCVYIHKRCWFAACQQSS